jgi:hypothetical protein
MASAGKTFFAQFTKVRSIHRGIYERKTMNDNKELIPQLAIDTEFCHRVFVNPCTI